MGLNFILADDQEESLRSTKSYMERLIKNNNIDGKIVCYTKNPEDVINYSKEHKDEINIYILDINFEHEINGIALARNIREQEPFAYIIFLTAYIQHSMLIFKYRLKAYDFLVKPISYSDLEECIIALKQDFNNMSKHELPSINKSITFKSGYHEYQISINQILYIESFGPKIIIHMMNGEIESYATLKDIETMISKITDIFVRSHKSYIVNLKFIKKIDLQNQEIIMINGDRCLISRTQKKQFRALQDSIINAHAKDLD
jgi:two-component system, LytTR family, response regulator AgrA